MCKPSRWLEREPSRQRNQGSEAGRNIPMKPRLIAAGVLASLWLLGPPTWAVEYRLQVVNLDALTVLAYIDNTGSAPPGKARQSHLEARLDNGGFAAAAALPWRRVQLLHDPRYGGKPLAWLQAMPSAKESAWT